MIFWGRAFRVLGGFSYRCSFCCCSSEWMFYDMISLSIWKQLENFVPLQIQYQIFGIA